MKHKDLTGQKFGEWKVFEYAGNKNGRRDSYWVCECECGIKKYVVGYTLTSGSSKSWSASFCVSVTWFVAVMVNILVCG